MKTRDEIIDDCTGDYMLTDKMGIKEIVMNAMDRWHAQESELLREEIKILNKQLDYKYVDKH